MYGRKCSVARTTQNTVVKYPYNAVKMKHWSPDVFIQFEFSLWCTTAILPYAFHFLDAYQSWKLPGGNPDEWMEICRIKSIWLPCSTKRSYGISTVVLMPHELLNFHLGRQLIVLDGIFEVFHFFEQELRPGCRHVQSILVFSSHLFDRVLTIFLRINKK